MPEKFSRVNLLARICTRASFIIDKLTRVQYNVCEVIKVELIIPQRETLEIEFKSDEKKLHDNDLIDAVVAFANTHGGDLYLGVEDDGRITGLHPDHRDGTQLSAFIANKTIPPVSVRVETIKAEKPILQKRNNRIQIK